jgi:glucokinase
VTRRHVLGIDFGGTKVALGTLTLDPTGNRPQRTVRLETLAEAGADQVVERSLAAARALTDGPAAVGVSTFGVVSGDRIRLAPNVPGWEGLELPRLLRQEFGATPVVISNDVNAAATAELRWGALRGVDVGLYLNLGTGLAAAVIVNGRVLRGAHGAAGEIGYLLEPDADGSFADGRAPLEEAVSGGALTSRSAALLGRPVTASELFDLDGAADVAGLLARAMDTLAVAVANLCITIDPQRVVVGGGMMSAAHHILPRLTAVARRAVPFPPKIMAARYIHDAPLLGALALALEAADRNTAA